ncbi:MAG: beta strand repeat-containing protein, partial [Akkermansia sp.]
MKLHLPKMLLTALVAAVLAPQQAAADTTYNNGYTVSVPVGGNAYAGSYAFTFTISDLSTITDKTDILTYWGSENKSSNYSVNSFYFQLGETTEGDPTYTLRVASGKLAENDENAAYSTDGGDGYKTNIINASTGSLTLKANVVYSVVVLNIPNNSTNGWQYVYITDGSNTATANYNGGMNGSEPSSLGSRFNSAFAVTTTSSTWTGTAGDSAWATEGNWNGAFAAGNNVIFGTTTEKQTITVAEGGVSVNEMTVSGEYSYTGGSVTANLLRVNGGTATFDGALSADSILLTNSAGLTLTNDQFAQETLKTIGMDSSSSLTITSTADATLLNKVVGNGTLKLTGGHTFTQNHDGTDVTYSSKLHIDAGTTLALQANYKYHEILSGGLAGAGTLQSFVPTIGNTQIDGFKKTTITGDTSSFTGTWELQTQASTNNSVDGNRRVMGILNDTTGTFGGVVSFIGSGNAYNSTIDARNKTQQSMLVLARDYSLGGLKSDSSLGDVIVMGGTADLDASDNANYHTAVGTARTLTITGNNADTATFGGIIHKSLTLKIAANASQAFRNATLNGAITVQNGGQLVSSGSTLGTGATLTVENGAKVKEQISGITLGNNTTQVTWNAGSVYTLTGDGSGKEINLTNTASDTEGVVNLASGISKVELNGVSNVALTAGTINRDLIINNNGDAAAGIITASGAYMVNGSVSGSGNLQWNVAKDNTSTLTFTGSLKDWNTSENGYQNWCGLVANGAGEVTAVIAGTLAEDADRTVNMAFNVRQGTLKLTVQRDAEFTQRVEVSSLAVDSGTSKLSGSADLSVGTTTVGKDATLELARNSGKIGTLSGAGTVKSTAGTATMTVGADFTGALEAVGGNLTLSAAETAIYLQSLTIQGGSKVTAPSVSMG